MDFGGPELRPSKGKLLRLTHTKTIFKAPSIGWVFPFVETNSYKHLVDDTEDI